MRVGIEVGGTFTDLVGIGGDQFLVTKVPSTPASPSEGAIDALVRSGIDISQIGELVHGSTVATNAILERKGGKTAFVTTKGFRDILFLQRHSRLRSYDLYYKKPEPIVKRADCFEVAERMVNGEVVILLDEADVRDRLVPALKAGNYMAIAICLVGSYANEQHEARLEAIIAEALPDVKITRSSVVSGEFREYERASTTALAAYVQPVIDGYLARFKSELASLGFQGRLSLMQSNGGRLPIEGMRRNAITAVLSGPAAGLTGAIRQVSKSGYDRLMTFDMGGTSTDVSLVENARASMAGQTDIDGLPIQTPVLDIATVGAGGGSIGWIDSGGMLRVGPVSAGAKPGPASYDRGGVLPTVTDALVLMGLIPEDSVFGGAVKINKDKARQAFSELAAHHKLGEVDMAELLLRLAAANIVRAVQVVSTQRGHDPRDFVLVPFGGAGPLLSGFVASELGVDRIVVPPNPGLLSAYGLLVADDMKVKSATERMIIDDAANTRIAATYRRLRGEIETELAELNLEGDLKASFSAEMRYVGQAFEITVDIPTDDIDAISHKTLRRSFDEAHKRVFLHAADERRPVEAVSFRLALSRRGDEVRSPVEPVSDASNDMVEIYVNGAAAQCARVAVSSMAVGKAQPGPSLLKGYSSTIFVPSGWEAKIDAQSNVLLSRV